MRTLLFPVVLILILNQSTDAQTYHQANVGTLISNTDANAQTAYGTYDFQIGNGSGNTNYPASLYTYGNLINFNSANFGTQFIVTNSFTNPGFYFRSSYGSSYTAWAQIWTTTNFNPANYFPLSGGTITGVTSIEYTSSKSATANLYLTTSDGNSMLLGSSFGASNYNNLVQSGDQALIFSGNLCIAPWANGTSGIRIANNGNVGIGTAYPQSLLAVNGIITSKQVTVAQTGWSDFVFNKGYTLPNLLQVKTYIRGHHHLPDIPSAKEVEKDGLNLGDMQQKQMQKIEELTLYAIDQDKQIKSQQRTIEQLKKMLSDQNERIKALEKAMNK